MSTVTVNPDKTISVNGEKHFPVEAWGGIEIGSDIATGFNGFQKSYIHAGTKEGAITYLNQAQAVGKMLRPEFDRSKLAAGDTAYVRDYVNALKDYPALYGWDIDEPSTHGISLDELQAAYDTAKEEDPNHIFVVTHWTPERAEMYKNCYDIYETDYYPINENWGNRATAMYDFSKKIKAMVSAADPKPCWALIQSFGEWGWLLPTNQEVRCMSYISIAVGGKGVGFWQYGETRLELWTYINDLASELTDLSPVFLAPDSTKSISSSPDAIDVLLKDYNGELYLIAVNKDSGSINTQFSISSLGDTTATIIGEMGEGSAAAGRTVQINNGEFIDTFDARAVHIYEIGEGICPKPTSLFTHNANHCI